MAQTVWPTIPVTERTRLRRYPVRGVFDRATVYPRRVIESALKRGAAALVLAHNHPNANLTPSDHDKILTRAIIQNSRNLSERRLAVAALCALRFRFVRDEKRVPASAKDGGA